MTPDIRSPIDAPTNVAANIAETIQMPTRIATGAFLTLIRRPPNPASKPAAFGPQGMLS